MKLYGYRNMKGKINEIEIEVEEQTILVPKDGSNFPFIYARQIQKNEIGKIFESYCFGDAVFLNEPDLEKARSMFLGKIKREYEKYKMQCENSAKELEVLKGTKGD